MKRILYVTDSLMAGGTEQQLVTLIRALDRSRFQVFVLCLYGDKMGRSLHFLKPLQELGIPVTVLDQSSRPHLLTAIIRAVWRVRPDLIQAVNYHSNLLARLARPFMPRPTKLIGCIYVECTRKQLLYEQLSAWVCDALVCNSPHIVKQLYGVLGKRQIELIYNGVDGMRFASCSDIGLRDRYASGAKCVFLVMGRIARQKAPHLVATALGLLRERDQLPSGTFMWVVGEYAEQDAQVQLEQAVRRYGLEAVVRQFPATDQPELYYQAADVVVVASLWEGLPNVVVEGMAAGRPVVVSEAANRASVVQDGVNGWIVCTGDVEHLAAVLGQILDSLSAVRDMRQACQQAALPFSVMKMAGAYSDLYDGVSARV